MTEPAQIAFDFAEALVAALHEQVATHQEELERLFGVVGVLTTLAADAVVELEDHRGWPAASWLAEWRARRAG